MAKDTIGGGIAGAGAGALVGLAGTVTGPGVLATESGGVTIGTAVGLGGGAAYGMSNCSSSGDSGTTQHGAEQMAKRKISQAEIDEAKTGQKYEQEDGATAFVKKVGRGRYNIVIEGEGGIVTAMKNLSKSEVNALARNYGWGGYAE